MFKQKYTKAVIIFLVIAAFLFALTVPCFAIEVEGVKKTYNIDVENTLKSVQGYINYDYADGIVLEHNFNKDSWMTFSEESPNDTPSWCFNYYPLNDLDTEDEDIPWNNFFSSMRFEFIIPNFDIDLTDGFVFLRDFVSTFNINLYNGDGSWIAPKQFIVEIDYGDGTFRPFYYSGERYQYQINKDFNHNVSGDLRFAVWVDFDNDPIGVNSNTRLFFSISKDTTITLENISESQLQSALSQVNKYDNLIKQMQTPGSVQGGPIPYASLGLFATFLLLDFDNSPLQFLSTIISFVLIIAVSGYLLHGKRG